MTVLNVFTLDVSEKTVWIFFRLDGGDGAVGVGEATLNNRTGDVLEAVQTAAGSLASSQVSIALGLRQVRKALPGVVGRVVASGLEQAWLDLEGQRAGRPISALLGGAYRRGVPCYANINRGTQSRTPAEFADRAALALQDGYRAVKLAPFDNVKPDMSDEEARSAAIDAGLQRIAAVVERLDGSGHVHVDCHSRFRGSEAASILDRVAATGVAWFEEPIAEVAEALDEIAQLRSLAGRHRLILAGAEKCADLGDFLPFLVKRCYDVIMPDIVLAGGPTEVVRVGHLAASLGTQVSLHNPCGPVMDMHSVHAAAAVPELHSLERQFRESPLYDDIVSNRAHAFSDGELHLADVPGLGLTVDWGHPSLTARARLQLDL
ncbi:MAG: enolase C-terminal domain-like protein [Pseudomonadota bacterium]